MPVKYVTHPNGFTEIMGVLTPREEIEWLTRCNKVSRFPSANHLTSLKPKTQPPSKPQQGEKLKYLK
jgi:hypothetical protein